MNTQTNFEAWAKLLITRKVPEKFTHLISADVIHSGADILKRGESFEVHLETISAEPVETAPSSTSGWILVTPMPHLTRASAN